MTITTKIPQTREEAIQVFTESHETSPNKQIIVRSMTGVYDCWIGMGKNHMEAYELALRARLGEPKP